MSTPFIINLNKTKEGFVFHSIQQPTQYPNKGNKYKASVQSKPNQSRITNRLIKQIEQITDKPYHPEENHNMKEPNFNQEEQIRQYVQITQQQEDIDCQIKRENKLPYCPADWFNIKSINQIEVKHFPQFYSGKSYKTPQLYLSYRNFMVEAFLKNPKRYLTFIACRRVLRGDVNTLLKIFKFLQYHGIINYCIFIQGNYTFKPASQDKITQLALKPQTCIRKLPEASNLQDNIIDTDNLTVTVINKHFSRTFRVYCSKCKLICGIVWFISSPLEQSQKNICFQCYGGLDIQIKQQFFKTDLLKKMEVSKQNKSLNKTSWGLEDNIKLLQFMSNSQGKEWNDIVGQFQGKKSLEDIIIQFMQFPITNFDSKNEFKSLKPQQIDSTSQQHVQMLYKLYQQSSYAIKSQQKQQQPQKRSSDSNISLFKHYSSQIIEKYVNKINKLQTLQNFMEQTNLNINEQLLCNRIKINKDAQENGNSMRENSQHQEQN